MNTVLHAEFPGVLTIAEESTSWPGVSHPVHTGGLGFTMKWDMGWMNDTLHFLRREPVHRGWHLQDVAFRSVYAFAENFVLPLSHDEVVHGKRSLASQMPGDQWQQLAGLRLLLALQYATPGKKLQFMGAELGQWTEWNHDGELDWSLRVFPGHEGVRQLLQDLNRLYCGLPALHRADHDSCGFQWIVGDDSANCVVAWIRETEDGSERVVVVINYTPAVRSSYRVGVPLAGYYREELNSDSEIYGGSGVGNQGGLYSTPEPSHGREHSLCITVPPLAVIFFRCIAPAADPAI